MNALEMDWKRLEVTKRLFRGCQSGSGGRERGKGERGAVTPRGFVKEVWFQLHFYLSNQATLCLAIGLKPFEQMTSANKYLLNK